MDGTFADLHLGPLPLLLPNAWDLPSALAFVAAGYPVIGTTSFGVASSHGVPDGGRGTRAANLGLAGQLCRLPVLITLDIEDGYTHDPAEVAAYVAELRELGVVGVNLEDSLDGRLVDPAVLAHKLTATKDTSPEVFLNARVDTYWFEQDASVETTVARARTYADAGADGIFVPGITDPDVIQAIAGSLAVPLNVLPVPGRSLADLAALGVRRVSTGSLPYRASVAAAVGAADAVRDGTPPPPSVPYWDLHGQLTAYAEDAGRG